MAYIATFTADAPKPDRIGRNYGLVTGTVDITSYHATLAEITDLTKFFIDNTITITAAPCGITDNGYFVTWVGSSGAFKAWKGDYSASVDGPLVECANDLDVGAFKVIVTGIYR